MPPEEHTLEIPVIIGEENEMSNGTADAVQGDIDQDCAELLAEDTLTGHKQMLEDISANIEVASQHARNEASRKYAEVDPIQAAAAERVLKKA